MRPMMILLLVLAMIINVDAAPVLVTPLIKANKLDAARNLTAIWYKGDFYGYAGHFTTSQTQFADRLNHIYTWFQPCSNCDSETAPLLIWLQGGPGGPGWFGAFAEIGNTYIGGNTVDAEPHPRCFSWCITNNCLFVDQPVNTGFSYQTMKSTGKPVTNVSDVKYTNLSSAAMVQVLDVLLQFYQVFPEVKNSPLTITGESYGGLYTPNLGYLIAKHNSNSSPSSFKINFAGLAVGDPCINWGKQMLTYADTLYGMGVLMIDEREDLRARMISSVAQLDNCPVAFDTWNQVWDDNGGLEPSQGRGWFAKKTGSFNTANILMGNSPSGWNQIFDFWNKPRAALAFHVDNVPSPSNASLNGINVYDAFVQSGDWCANSSWLYADLMLNTDIDLMIYSSTSDSLLGPPTTEAGILAILEDLVTQNADAGVKISKDFQATAKDIWFVESKDTNPAGYAKCIRVDNKGKTTTSSTSNTSRFCYTVVRNAGHETPGYQPRAAYDMIERFLNQRNFTSSGDATDFPTCSECSGVGPFAGAALPMCSK
jgi:vitellogenic carboxypeptidase-like protein